MIFAEGLVAKLFAATFFPILVESATALFTPTESAIDPPAKAASLAKTAPAFLVEGFPFPRFGAWHGARRCFIRHDAEAGVVPADGHLGKSLQDVLGQGLWEFYGAELVKEFDAANVAAADIAFAGNGTHDIFGAYVVHAGIIRGGKGYGHAPCHAVLRPA